MVVNNIGDGRIHVDEPIINQADKIQSIKALIDKECYEQWQAKRCNSRIGKSAHFTYDARCWTCIRNYELARKISEL